MTYTAPDALTLQDAETIEDDSTDRNLLVRIGDFCLILWLLFVTFEGPIKFVLISANASVLIYFRDVCLAYIVALGFIYHGALKPSFRYFVAAALLAIGTFVGLIYLKGLLQIAIGYKSLLPALAGLVLILPPRLIQRRFGILAILIVAATLFGLGLNLLMDFPWEGTSYDVGNFQMSTSKAVQKYYTVAGDVDRKPGFARSSATTASILLMIGLYAAIAFGRTAFSGILWFVCGIGVIVTTIKGDLLAWLALTPFVIAWLLSFQSTQRILLFVGLLGTFMCVAMPFAANDAPHWSFEQAIHPSLQSLDGRFCDCWPESWKFTEEKGSWFFGRGIGGSGLAKFLIEPEYYRCMPDNLFLELYVVWGWLAFIIIAGLVWQFKIACDDSFLSDDCYFVAMAIMANIYNGWTGNMLAEPILSFIFGITLNYVVSDREMTPSLEATTD